MDIAGTVKISLFSKVLLEPLPPPVQACFQQVSQDMKDTFGNYLSVLADRTPTEDALPLSGIKYDVDKERVNGFRVDFPCELNILLISSDFLCEFNGFYL